MPRLPVFATPAEERRHRKERLAGAFRLFSKCGFDEGVAGHITARDPERLDHFWVNPFGIHFSQIRVSDLLLVNDHGEVVEGDREVNLAAFAIHSRIHKARPDVMAVLHNHSPSLIPFCNSDTRLRPMVGSAAFLGDGAPVFDIRTIDDEGDLNICTMAQGKGLARALGTHGLVLLRGHGAVAVGDSVRQVVRRAIIAESNAKQQIQATLLGPVHFLTPSEIEYAKRMKPKDPDRAWRLWKQRAMGE